MRRARPDRASQALGDGELGGGAGRLLGRIDAARRRGVPCPMQPESSIRTRRPPNPAPHDLPARLDSRGPHGGFTPMLERLGDRGVRDRLRAETIAGAARHRKLRPSAVLGRRARGHLAESARKHAGQNHRRDRPRARGLGTAGRGLRVPRGGRGAHARDHDPAMAAGRRAGDPPVAVRADRL